MPPILHQLVRLLLVAAFFASCLVVLVLALGPPPQALATIQDKIQHFAAFTTLTVLGLAAFAEVRPVWVAVGLVAGGAAVELLQGLPVFHRDCSFGDLIADTAGILVGLGMALVFRLARRTLTSGMRPS